jgi:hypothetical protein
MDPKPLPKWFLHIVHSRASSFKWEYPLLSLRSSSSFLRLFPRLLVTSISPFIFPSITCFRGQFLHKMWPIQLAFHFHNSCGIFLCSLTLSNTSSFLTFLSSSWLMYNYYAELWRSYWPCVPGRHEPDAYFVDWPQGICAQLFTKPKWLLEWFLCTTLPKSEVSYDSYFFNIESSKVKGKAIPLQALTGSEGSRRLRLPDCKTFGTCCW